MASSFNQVGGILRNYKKKNYRIYVTKQADQNLYPVPLQQTEYLHKTTNKKNFKELLIFFFIPAFYILCSPLFYIQALNVPRNGSLFMAILFHCSWSRRDPKENVMLPYCKRKTFHNVHTLFFNIYTVFCHSYLHIYIYIYIFVYVCMGVLCIWIGRIFDLPLFSNGNRSRWSSHGKTSRCKNGC